jgi:hypothetical protein
MRRDRQLDLFSFELMIAGLFVWLRWGWDAALLSVVSLIAVFGLLARLDAEAKHWVFTVWGGNVGLCSGILPTYRKGLCRYVRDFRADDRSYWLRNSFRCA